MVENTSERKLTTIVDNIPELSKTEIDSIFEDNNMSLLSSILGENIRIDSINCITPKIFPQKQRQANKYGGYIRGGNETFLAVYETKGTRSGRECQQILIHKNNISTAMSNAQRTKDHILRLSVLQEEEAAPITYAFSRESACLIQEMMEPDTDYTPKELDEELERVANIFIREGWTKFRDPNKLKPSLKRSGMMHNGKFKVFDVGAFDL